MGVASYRDMMTRFRWGFASADKEMLDSVLAPGFEWHTHTYPASARTPTGRILYGIDEMIDELEWRKRNWVGVKFEGLDEHFAPGLVTQRFTISGRDQGTRFHTAAVDLYDVTPDDRILKKATYWKQLA